MNHLQFEFPKNFLGTKEEEEEGGGKRLPAARKHLICPCGTRDRRSARTGGRASELAGGAAHPRDAPPPPRPALPRGVQRGPGCHRPLPVGAGRAGAEQKAEGCQTELAKGKPLTFQRRGLDFISLDHGVLTLSETQR